MEQSQPAERQSDVVEQQTTKQTTDLREFMMKFVRTKTTKSSHNDWTLR